MSSSADDDHHVPPFSNASLSFPDCLNGRTVRLALVADGILQTPKKLRAHIMRPLELIKYHKWVFAHHRRQQALPPLACVVAECSPCGRVRIMLPCVAFACHRMVTAPADMHMAHTSWSWAEVVMERVTRGRVRRVQETVAGFEVRCCALQLLYEAPCGVHYCVQAAAAARVAGGHDILESAKNGDRASVLCHLIVNNDGAKKQDADQCIPLHHSASRGHIEVCRILLQCNADVEAKTRSRSTPLHYSAINGRIEVCRLLLDCKADVEAKTCGRSTPLHWSARDGRLEVSRLLVESKADVAARNNNGKTALTFATDCNNADVAAYLRSIGAPE